MNSFSDKIFTIPVTKNKNIESQNELREKTIKFSSGSFSSFDELKLFLDNYRILWSIEGGDYCCSCSYYQKKGTCKHSLGLQIYFEKVQLPRSVTSVPVGKKRKPGRPRKITLALQLDSEPSESATQGSKKRRL
jgi:hypothetical protein